MGAVPKWIRKVTKQATEGVHAVGDATRQILDEGEPKISPSSPHGMLKKYWNVTDDITDWIPSYRVGKMYYGFMKDMIDTPPKLAFKGFFMPTWEQVSMGTLDFFTPATLTTEAWRENPWRTTTILTAGIVGTLIGAHGFGVGTQIAAEFWDATMPFDNPTMEGKEAAWKPSYMTDFYGVGIGGVFKNLGLVEGKNPDWQDEYEFMKYQFWDRWKGNRRPPKRRRDSDRDEYERKKRESERNPWNP